MYSQKGFFSNYHFNIAKKNLKGQIAVIITLVIAVIFLLTIVFINIAKVSQIKTVTAITADRAALSLASALGSLSHQLVKKLGGLELCEPNWEWILGWALIFGGFLLGLFFPPLIPLTLAIGRIMVGAGAVLIGYEIDAMMKESLPKALTAMTNYSAIREATIETILTSLVTDAEEVERLGGNIFLDPKTGITYDLTGSAVLEKIKDKLTIPRFIAWYWGKRSPLVSDQIVAHELAYFVKNLKDLTYYPPADWDSTKWEVRCLSLPVNYLGWVTSTSPSWVIDSDSVKVVGPVCKNETTKAKGFLMEKFVGLLSRLKDKGYDPDICGASFWSWLLSDCPNVEAVVEEIRGFLANTMEVLNTPITIRLQTITQWLPLFYTLEEHNPDGSGSSIDDDLNDDIYERLLRARQEIERWIEKLTTLNEKSGGIKETIEKKHGECTWGRGAGVSSECANAYGCDCNNCGACSLYCCGPCDCECCDMCCPCECWCCHTCCWYVTNRVSPCAWEGTYYTCCENPPVCSNGDLYGGVPGWCSSHGDQAGCHSNCLCNVHSFNCDENAKFFQGQLAYNNTSAPTEVGQALEILEELVDTINKINLIIHVFAEKVRDNLNQNEVLKNEAIYAWRDKEDRYHLISAKLVGYPALEDFPRIVQTREWANFLKCKKVKGQVEGNFYITASRYSQDQPSSWWNLRYRAVPVGADADPAQLQAIMQDVHDNGMIDSTGGYVVNVSYYAIKSQTKGHYGYKTKEDIYIEREK